MGTGSNRPHNPATPSAALGALADSVRNFFPQKYSQYLGDAGRSACGHYIDPQDVHALSSDRFVMALVTRGTTGTACAGVVQFVVLQANCAAPQLYQLSTRADRR